jgi:hypothetical protein
VGRNAPRLAAILATVLSLFVTSLPASALARRVIRIPTAIDRTGQTDVTAQIQQFVASAPNGTTVVFPHGARYRIDGTLQWDDQSGVTLEGNGATLFAGTPGDPTRATIRLINGSNWTIRDMTIRGANATGGQFDPRYQWQHGIDLRGVRGALIRHVTVTNVFGDDIYIGLSTTASDRWSRDVSVVDSTGMSSGRMAVAITAGRNITVRGGSWSNPGLSTFDLEPNGPSGGARHVVIEDGTVGAGRRGTALSIAGSGPVSDVILEHMRLTGRPLTVLADQTKLRPQHLVLRGNVSTVPFAGPQRAAMFFSNVDGVTISGNTQPVQPGTGFALIATSHCTKVKVSGQGPDLELSSAGSLSPIIIGLGASAYLVLLCVAWRKIAGPTP